VSDRDAYEVLQVQPGAHQLVVQAAFRVLASIYHPDRDSSAVANRMMVELNVAYAKVRNRDVREAYDRERKSRQAATAPTITPPTRTPNESAPGMIDFGRYNGWTVSRLARHDPDYLRWLSRHSSGIRYRRQIAEELDAAARPTASERVRGK